jgi:hypothetical protein
MYIGVWLSAMGPFRGSGTCVFALGLLPFAQGLVHLRDIQPRFIPGLLWPMQVGLKLSYPVFRFLASAGSTGGAGKSQPGAASPEVALRQLSQYNLRIGDDILIIPGAIHTYTALSYVKVGADALRSIAKSLVSGQAEQIIGLEKYFPEIVIKPELQPPVTKQQFPARFPLGSGRLQRAVYRQIGGDNISTKIGVEPVPAIDDSLLSSTLLLESLRVLICPGPDVRGVFTAHCSSGSF